MLLERLMNFINVDLQEAKVFVFSTKLDQFFFFFPNVRSFSNLELKKCCEF